jgi:hypothetical protein
MFWKDEEEESKLSKWFFGQIEGRAPNYTLKQFLSLCLIVNIAIWFVVLVFPNYVYSAVNYATMVSDKLLWVIIGIPLWFSAWFVYCLFRLKFPDIDEETLDSEIMSSYSFQNNSTKHWKIWIASITFGVVNAALLVFADLSLATK